MTNEEMTAIVDSLTDEMEAFTLLNRLRQRFQWSGTMFCPEDIQAHILSCHEADELPEPTEAELDEMVQTLIDSWEYRKGLKDRLTEEGWELIGMAYEEMMYERKKEKAE